MLRLNDNNTSYIIISASLLENTDKKNKKLTSTLETELYALQYDLFPVDGYINGLHEKSFMAYKDVDNNELRMEAIKLMTRYGQDDVIIKYLDESSAKKIYNTGEERLLDVTVFSDEQDNKSYICGTHSFSFLEKRRYYFPNEQKQFKIGLTIEMQMNDGSWEERVVESESEWGKVYRLMSKYQKVRVEY